jgi:hypothetical protein
MVFGARYLKLLELGIPAGDAIDRRLPIARYFASTGRQGQVRRILALDPGNAQARQLLK